MSIATQPTGARTGAASLGVHSEVGKLRKVRRMRRRRQRFDRWRGEARHLQVIPEQVHHPEPFVQIDHRWNAAHTLLHIGAACGDRDHAIEIGRRQDVAKEVYLHRCGSYG